MFLTKRAIPRRTFLRGAGVTLALPLLESMIPAATALAQTPAAGSVKPRFVGVFYPHGMAPGYWETRKGRCAAREAALHHGTAREGPGSSQRPLPVCGPKSAEPPEWNLRGSDHWDRCRIVCTAINPRRTCGFRCQCRQSQHHRPGFIRRQDGQENLLQSIAACWSEDPKSSSQQLRRRSYSCS
jgi:hypothetical protein